VDPYGQFASPYSGMGNTPNLYSDPDGGWSWTMAGAGFVLGAGVGYAIGGDWQAAFIGGLAGGVLAGASFKESTSRYDVGVRTETSVKNITPSPLGNFLAETPGLVTGTISSLLDVFRKPKHQIIVEKVYYVGWEEDRSNW
jgi:hypothetical protein